MPAPIDRFRLDGKVAIVTGGSRGLGREMALGFAQAGADVVVASRKLASCEDAAAMIEAATGRRALPVACHVGRWGDVEALAETAYRELGHVDVLVNNAGMSPLYPDAVSLSEELYDKVFDVNLKGPFRLSAIVGARMAAEDGGSIVNISSLGAIRPDANIIPYAAAKAGLNAITVALARELGPKVRVNAIMPGSFLTDISEVWDPSETAARERTFALRRSGAPDEIVGAALYFASDASSFTTGAILRVDGGAI